MPASVRVLLLSVFFGCLAAGLLPAGLSALEAAKKMDEEKLVGSWKLTRIKIRSKEAPAEVLEAELGFVPMMSFTADGKGINDLAFFEREGSSEFKYKLAGAGKIDLLMGGGTKEALWKIEGDALTICMPIKLGLKRPTEFKADNDHAVFVLERAKPLTPEEISKRKVLVEKVREKGAQIQSTNNLKQIALAMHTYHDVYKSLPAGAIYSKDGKTPLLSWRVSILPYIGEATLYNEFKLDEPWDSEHNKKLIPKMPQVYAFPLAPEKAAREGKTYYQVFTGKDTVFDGSNKMSLLQITDGTSNTILVVEAKDPVIWSKPEDLTLPKDRTKIPPLGGHFKKGFNVAFADGHVDFFRPDPPAATMRLLINPNDGNAVDVQKLLQTEK